MEGLVIFDSSGTVRVESRCGVISAVDSEGRELWRERRTAELVDFTRNDEGVVLVDGGIFEIVSVETGRTVSTIVPRFGGKARYDPSTDTVYEFRSSGPSTSVWSPNVPGHKVFYHPGTPIDFRGERGLFSDAKGVFVHPGEGHRFPLGPDYEFVPRANRIAAIGDEFVLYFEDGTRLCAVRGGPFEGRYSYGFGSIYLAAADGIYFINIAAGVAERVSTKRVPSGRVSFAKDGYKYWFKGRIHSTLPASP